jgi:hypothetical protein
LGRSSSFGWVFKDLPRKNGRSEKFWNARDDTDKKPRMMPGLPWLQDRRNQHFAASGALNA